MTDFTEQLRRGQMTVVNDHLAHHKHVQGLYEQLLADVKGVTVHKQPDVRCKMADGREIPVYDSTGRHTPRPAARRSRSAWPYSRSNRHACSNRRPA